MFDATVEIGDFVADETSRIRVRITSLDPINLIIVPLILAIGIDDGVYIVVGARKLEDIAATVRTAGRALVVTSMTTIVGFGFLGSSRYPPLATMGLLVALGVFLCLIGSIILLPVLLARTEARGA